MCYAAIIDEIFLIHFMGNKYVCWRRFRKNKEALNLIPSFIKLGKKVCLSEDNLNLFHSGFSGFIFALFLESGWLG